MMARKKGQRASLIEELAKRFLASIITLAKKENIPQQEIIEYVFGTVRLPIDCRVFEKFELNNPDYVVIPVIVKKKNTETIKKLLELNSTNLAAYIENVKAALTTTETDLAELLKEFCPFDECDDKDITLSTIEPEETTEKKKRGRGRPKKTTDEEVIEKPQKKRGRPPKKRQEELKLSDEELDVSSDEDIEYVSNNGEFDTGVYELGEEEEF
jgi:hypothetical protein